MKKIFFIIILSSIIFYCYCNKNQLTVDWSGINKTDLDFFGNFFKDYFDEINKPLLEALDNIGELGDDNKKELNSSFVIKSTEQGTSTVNIDMKIKLDKKDNRQYLWMDLIISCSFDNYLYNNYLISNKSNMLIKMLFKALDDKMDGRCSITGKLKYVADKGEAEKTGKINYYLYFKNFKESIIGGEVEPIIGGIITINGIKIKASVLDDYMQVSSE